MTITYNILLWIGGLSKKVNTRRNYKLVRRVTHTIPEGDGMMQKCDEIFKEYQQIILGSEDLHVEFPYTTPGLNAQRVINSWIFDKEIQCCLCLEMMSYKKTDVLLPDHRCANETPRLSKEDRVLYNKIFTF